MQRRTILGTVLLAATLPGLAHGAIFVCHDEHGAPLTTDHLSRQCLLYGGKELNPDGSVRRVILSPQRQAALDAAQQAAQRAAQDRLDTQREMRALRTRFPDAASVRRAEDAALRTPRALIANAHAQLRALAAEHARLEQDAQFYPNHDYPPDLRGRFETNAVLRDQQTQLISAQQRVIAHTQARYAELLRRLRRLWARDTAGAPR